MTATSQNTEALRMSFLSNFVSSMIIVLIFWACSQEPDLALRNQPASPPSRIPTSSQSSSLTSRSTRIFVYKDLRSELVEIFDLNRNMVVQGGQDLMRDPANAWSEFSGPIDSCRDTGFFCFETGLHIAVPRNSGPRQWTVSHLSCRANPTEDSNIDTVLCRNEITGSAVRFRYSSSRGVLSYTSLCDQCWPQEFVLVGDRGLFARDQ